MATARLRKVFHYPADNSDDDDTPGDLDEEEQEKLIAKLRDDNDKGNKNFRRILLAFPTISAFTYVPALITSRLLQVKFLCFLSMTSLIGTAYSLVFVPATQPKPANRLQLVRDFDQKAGPINSYLGYLNGCLSLLVLLNALNLKDKDGVHEGFWLLCILPAIIFLFIMVAKRIMMSIDLSELESLRYGYKGA